MNWDFKAAKVTGPNQSELVELSPLQENRKNLYLEALGSARKSQVPDPPFSNYHVKGAVTDWTAPAIPAGNIEYGLCQALHCEESAVAALRAFQNEKTKNLQVLGFCESSEGKTTPPRCCGNCRDILLDAFGPNLELVSGGPNGGLAVVSSLKDLLLEKFRRICMILGEESDSLVKIVEEMPSEGKKLLCDPYSPREVHPERRYFVCIETFSGNKYFGARDLMCDYHPIYPGRDASRQAIRNRDPFIKRVVVLAEEYELSNTNPKPPHVLYKDRQHLLETNLQSEILQDKEIDPPVYLCTRREPTNIDRTVIWHTTLKEWLPFPFMANAFGKEFLKNLSLYYKNR